MSAPILVFDSGVGGLSIVAEIRSQLPKLDIHYLFDDARLPYGRLAETELVDGCVELICKAVDNTRAGMVVVACNTASTLVLPSLRERLAIPVVGVVPAIKPAAALTQNHSIAVLATLGTIKRDYTQQLIEDFANGCKVHLFAASEMVAMAEAKLAGEPVNMVELEMILSNVRNSGADTLVLGCTHFPVLRDEIASVLGEETRIVDSGRAIANRVAALLVDTDAENFGFNKRFEFSHTRAELPPALNTYLKSYAS
ncbi:glutamate racemase [Paraferrimonas sedimenticola]|uniref:Glutamate racemase n=1 Tax=Paraferrimonas sedimenticola TaxID=375674 RepID=A0AA37RV87_9GAMM|nr:glutamate racemase [Paraferrimonas sedimenticola]GLP95242.1 glutamate racemase [Paraferrimonas sedimenticola]